MTKVQEKHHYYTDQERYEYCRKCKLSGKTISEFAREYKCQYKSTRSVQIRIPI